MKKILFLFLIISLFSCKNSDNAVISWKSYNLKGQVKLISDKIIPSKYDTNWVIQPDSTITINVLFKNRFFNNSGTLINFEYYNIDSVLILKNDYIFSKSGKHIGSNIFQNGKLTEQVKILKSSNSFTEAETYDHSTNELRSKTHTDFINALTDKQTTVDLKNNFTQELTYKRDKSGNETEIYSSIKFNEKVETTITKVKYLEFDSIGNWTKKIEFNPDKNNDCLLTIRTIKYY